MDTTTQASRGFKEKKKMYIMEAKSTCIQRSEDCPVPQERCMQLKMHALIKIIKSQAKKQYFFKAK